MPLSSKLSDVPQPPIWTVKPSLLLHPQIPKPMHGLAPRTILGAKWWNAERQAAYQRTDYHCEACGVHKANAAARRWLECHEIYDINYSSCRMRFVSTTPLCHYCHNYIHAGRLKALLDKGEIHHAKYVAIMQHGDAVLVGAGVSKEDLEESRRSVQNAMKLHSPELDWNDWRLVIEYNGSIMEIPPKFKSYEEWEAGHE